MSSDGYDYATAGSFNIHNEQLINSTMNIPDDFPTDGSAEMSIELGRGGRTRAQARDNDMSSNIIFDLGNNSQYEVTATPPIKARAPNSLRREASLRRASTAVAGLKSRSVQHRSLSETLAKLDMAAEEQEEQQATATFQPRNTRFVPRARQPSSANHMIVPAPSRFIGAAEATPRRATLNNNPTVQSATYTANSFQLPDMPNITNLIQSPAVVRNSHTTGTRSRSRFTSASYRALHTEHTAEYAAIESVPIPEEEKAIYASLQMLKDRVGELEMDKAELLGQLQAQQNRRGGSSLGSDEGKEETARSLRVEKGKLQTLQSRLEKTERKVSVSEITIQRIAKERDQLAAQVEMTLHDNDQLRAELAELREELAILRHAIYGMSERPPAAPKRVASEPERRDVGHRGGTAQLEVRRRRTSHAKTSERRASASPDKRDLFEHVVDAEPTQTELSQTGHGAQVDRDLTELSFMDPKIMADLRKRIEEEHIKSKREREEENKRQQERPVMPRKSSLKDITAGLENVTDERPVVPRKSSLRDVTAGLENLTGRFSINGEEETAAKASKTVRVQSPHTSDASFLPQYQQQEESAGDTSMLSNTSRRRRRAASVEGMTSAFILPDITIHSQHQAGSIPTCAIHHAAATCTACHPDTTIPIPAPAPVSTRLPEDVETTLRPAETPALALATVIKNLEDEITHLKLQLQAQEAKYLRHDPSLSKRARVATREKMRGLIQEVERKSDQVYRLYDVLEGQVKASGDGGEGGESGDGKKGCGLGERDGAKEWGFEGLSEDEEGDAGF